MFKSKFLLLFPLYGVFLPNIKYLGYKTGIQFNNTPLVLEQNSYTTKTVNAYIVYDLDNWPKILPKKFTLKNCLLSATNLGKDNDESKYVYSAYGITFDGLSFCNGFFRNVYFLVSIIVYHLILIIAIIF